MLQWCRRSVHGTYVDPEHTGFNEQARCGLRKIDIKVLKDTFLSYIPHTDRRETTELMCNLVVSGFKPNNLFSNH